MSMLAYGVCDLCQPGRLKGVQAIGWYLEEANMAQVSINISDHEETPLHTVYEEVCKEAKVGRFFIVRIVVKNSWTLDVACCL